MNVQLRILTSIVTLLVASLPVVGRDTYELVVTRKADLILPTGKIGLSPGHKLTLVGKEGEAEIEVMFRGIVGLIAADRTNYIPTQNHETVVIAQKPTGTKAAQAREKPTKPTMKPAIPTKPEAKPATPAKSGYGKLVEKARENTAAYEAAMNQSSDEVQK